MKGNVKIFKSKDFGRIRTVLNDGEVWFVGKDVASALGYSDANKAIAMHVFNEDKKLNDKTSSSFGQRGATLINESGLYSLILSSKLPSARSFKRWVVSEVLPTIRKYGAYITESKLDKVMNNTEEAEKLFRELKAEKMKNRDLSVLVEQLDTAVKALKIKGDFYDDVLSSEELIPMTVIAKDYGMSATRMNALLNAFGIQYKMRSGYWVLYAQYQNMGFTKTITYRYPSGRTSIVMYWTHAGRAFLYRFLKEEQNIIPKSERIQPYKSENDKETE